MNKDTLAWAECHFNDYCPAYKKYDEYYHGKQFSVFSNYELRESVGMLADVFENFTENVCPVIVNTTNDRLRISGFDVEENYQETIDRIWKQNKMLNKSSLIHKATLINGDAYVMVWYDLNGKARIYLQDTKNIAVLYDEDGENIIEAVKCWTVGKKIRLNVYYPDRTERYISKTDRATFSSTPEDYEAIDVIPNTTGRVPIFRFTNNSFEFAQSELTNVISLQDSLNWSTVYMLIGEVGAILPTKYITGQKAEKDPITQRPKRYRSKPGDIMLIGNENAKPGQFEAANLKQFLDIHNDMRQSIARISSTPLHSFFMAKGDYPSGAALKTAEAPLLGKVENRQNSYGETWAEVLKFAAVLEGVTGIEEVETIWVDTTPDNSKEESEVALNMIDAGVPKDEVMKKTWGYTDKQIEEWNAANMPMHGMEEVMPNGSNV